MEHILHDKYSHKIEAFKEMCNDFETQTGKPPNTHEKAKILSDAISLWTKETVDLIHNK